MGELGEELGRVLKVLFVNLWKHLDPNTQHWLEVLAITVGAVGFAVAVVKDLAKIRKSSVVGAIDAIGRSLRSCVRRINLLFLPAIGLLLLAAFGSWPYNFYILTRIVVWLTSVFYLKGFMDRQKTLWAYEKGKNAPRASTPKQEGHRENYYTFTDRGYPDDSAERMLSRAESMVALTIRKLANPQFKMTDRQRSELYSFVALTFVRVPAYREFIDKQAGKMMKAFGQEKAHDKDEFYAAVREYEAKTGKSIGMDPEELRIFAMSDRYTVTQKSVAFNLKMALQAGLTIAEILDREYSDDVFYAPERKFFLTCDNPIVTLAPARDGQATVGMGFAWPDTEVVFPLNKRACLILSRNGQRRQLVVSEKRVEQINDVMMGVAQRFVYASVGFRRLARIFNERGSKIRYGENAFISGRLGAR